MSTKDKLQCFFINLEYIRTKNHLSVHEMAHIMGVSVPIYKRLQKGELPYSVRTNVLYALFDYFHIMPSQWFRPMEP